MQCVWSKGVLDGKRGEDRVITVHREWPSRSAHHQEQQQQQHFPASVSPAADGLSSLSACCRLSVKPRRPKYSLLAVFDGHDGPQAAQFAAANIVAVVEALLPAWEATPSASEPFVPSPQMAKQLRQALVLAFLDLHCQFAATGRRGGCTATVVLQVGRLVTVANVGSSRCMLDMGADSSPLPLSKEHVISSNQLEQQRLLAAGCRVAAMDPITQRPARPRAGNDGVLRIWPGGLTLSRSLGDYRISDGILPLPHIKQVLLPPHGGRLTLATDSVWSIGGDGLMPLIRKAPLRLACHKVIKSINASSSTRVDASVIVADVLPSAPRPITFKTIVSRLEETRTAAVEVPAQLQDRSRPGAGKVSLKSLFGRSSKPVDAAELDALHGSRLLPPRAELLADLDSAAVLGLVTYGRSNGSPSAAVRAEDLSGEVAAALQHPPPLDVQTQLVMWSLLEEAPKLWFQALRQQRGRATPLQPAVEQQQSLVTDGVQAAANLLTVRASWLEAAAAAAIADYEAAEPPSSSPTWSAAPSSSVPSSPQQPQPPSPCIGLKSSLRSAAASPRGTGTPSVASPGCLRKQQSLPAGVDGAEDGSSGGGITRRVSFGPPPQDFALPSGSHPWVVSPRHLHPALPDKRAQQQQLQQRGTPLLSPAGSGSWRAATRAVTPGLDIAPAASPGGSLASSSCHSSSSSSSSSSLTLDRYSAYPLATQLPRRVSLEEGGMRRAAAGQLAASPGTKWSRAYSSVAGVYTKAGRGRSSRDISAAAARVDSWNGAYSRMAGTYLRRQPSAAP